MRALTIALMLAAIAQGTSAEPQAVKTDLMAVPNAEMSAESELLMQIQEFTSKLEEAGFKEVEIVSEAIVVRAKDKFDKPILLLVDPQTMVAVQLQSPPSETTGSGSSDENRFRHKD